MSRPKKSTVAPSAAGTKEQERATSESRRAALIGRVKENPHEFFTFVECGLILGFSDKAMGRLNAAGAPVAFRKMNPAMVCAWIAQHPQILEEEA